MQNITATVIINNKVNSLIYESDNDICRRRLYLKYVFFCVGHRVTCSSVNVGEIYVYVKWF